MTQMRSISSCGFGKRVEVDVVVMFDGHSHEGVAFGRDAPTAGMGDAGDQTTDVQALE